MNTKHTPGPWATGGYDIKAEDGRALIATVIRRYQNRSALDPDDEGAANARLIAAAPEMFDALSEVEWIFDGEEDITNNGGPNNAMKALAVVRAALRKAGAA
jgi:hypothetical protein